nr:hypothetical protein [Tanacetum cinerariifolium]
MTLIEAARTMLADSKLPTTFWAKAVNIACYVQNRVLVVKPHNKTPYELFHGRPSTLCFIRPFGCLVSILNTIDHLGKFDGKADEGFFVGYSLNGKPFRVFNSRTRIVEENLYNRFSESTPNVVGSGPDWLFDIDALTRTTNYEPIVTGTRSNDYADPKSSHDDGCKPSSNDGKKVDEDSRKENECNDQEKEDNVNSTNNVNTVSLTVNTAGTNEDNELPFDPNMPALEDVGIFNFSSNDKDDDHPLDQVIRDLQSATQTRKMTKNLEEHGFVSTIQQRTNHKDLQKCLLLAFCHKKNPKRNKKDERGIVIRNKARLVAQGYTKEEGIDYDEVIAPVARIEAIRLFLAYASFKDFVVYQMDVKSDFTYEKIKQEVYVFDAIEISDEFYGRTYILLGITKVKTTSIPMETQKPLPKDEDGEEEYVHMYRSMIGSLMYLTSLRPDDSWGWLKPWGMGGFGFGGKGGKVREVEGELLLAVLAFDTLPVFVRF